MRSFIGAVAVLVGIALIAVGCGGSGDDTGNTPTLTKAEFIARADRICARTDQEQREALRDFFKERPNAAVNQALNEKVVLEVGLPAIQAETEELDALPMPEGDEEDIQAIIDGLEEAIEKGEDDPGSLVTLKSGAGPFTAVGKLAGEYGFKVCSLPL